jgi:uncharacterized protein (TIGR02001 family)
MNYIKKTALSAAVVAGVLASGQSMATMEANIGVANNYIWRGVTQTQDQASISGGLDYSGESGFYLGTWTSNVDFGADETDTGYELDFYGGIASETDGFGYDLGYIYVAYPSMEDSDFSEVYLNGIFGGLTLGVAFQLSTDVQVDIDDQGNKGDVTDKDYTYFSAGYDFDINEEWGMGFYGGKYDMKNEGDVTHYGISASKGEFGFAVDKNDKDDDDDPRVTVSWSKSF